MLSKRFPLANVLGFASQSWRLGGSIACSRRMSAQIGVAADMSEPTASLAPLQRFAPLFPPAHCDNAAALRELPACTFGGSFANYAIYAN
ncbi:MAG: hypothetical protein R3E39_21245 [Anaerolineae bacterium]